MVLALCASHERVQAELQARLGPEVAVVCTGVDGDPDALWPEEKAAIARAVPKRQREFAAGRQAARAAMQRLGWPASAIDCQPDRSPLWPRGLVGSIAHTSNTCLAVVGRKNPWLSIGIDIEPDQGIEEPLWEIICTTGELHQVNEVEPAKRASLVTKVFVAKEAFYKWHFPQYGSILDFQEVSVNWESNESDFEIVSNPLCRNGTLGQGRGEIFVLGGCVTACVVSRTND
jgi:enterobactin synthetase component D